MTTGETSTELNGFPALASPVQLGSMRLRNRIVLNPHGLHFAGREEMTVTRRHVAYYEARAAGGVALVCMESTVCSLDGRSAPLTLSSRPETVPGYRSIADAVHAHGALVAGQITHYGNQSDVAITRAPLISASEAPDPLLRQPARRMDAADMERVREDFVASACNLVAAGFDGVELKLAHDGLLRQFMSPLTNHRTDEYGGSTERRLRYPLEVLAAVREAIGPGVTLSVRLVADECFPGGYGLDEGIRFAKLLDRSGLVDYLNSDLGITASMPMIVPPMGVPEGYSEKAFTRMAHGCSIPVIASGQIGSPTFAERIVAEGRAAAVGMARQLLADPDWAAKALGGRPEQIRPCTRCNQLCVGNAVRGIPVSCTVNPRAGNGERQGRGDQPSGHVVVVGGGPAGMEAALAAAGRGHRVTLHEATDALGGQLALAAKTGARTGWAPYLAWLGRELRRVGVELRLGSRATAEDVLASAPTSVIVACGSEATVGSLPRSSVLSVDEFIACGAVAPTVAIADVGAAGAVLWTAGLEAAMRGADAVSIVTPLPAPAIDLDFATQQWLRKELARLGVEVLADHTVTGLADGRLSLRHAFSGRPAARRVDLVVAVAPRRSRGEELRRVLSRRVPVEVVGDALSPRDATAAIREGQYVAEPPRGWRRRARR